MALHGEIKVNGIPIGAWHARRTEDLLFDAQVCTYECGVEYYGVGMSDPARQEFTVRHRYDEGAVALAAKVLTRSTT